MRKGEWDWLKLWDRTVAWGSVLPTEEWKRPDRILGAFLIVTPKVRCKLSSDERRIEIEDWLWRQKTSEQENA